MTGRREKLDDVDHHLLRLLADYFLHYFSILTRIRDPIARKRNKPRNRYVTSD